MINQNYKLLVVLHTWSMKDDGTSWQCGWAVFFLRENSWGDYKRYSHEWFTRGTRRTDFIVTCYMVRHADLNCGFNSLRVVKLLADLSYSFSKISIMSIRHIDNFNKDNKELHKAIERVLKCTIYIYIYIKMACLALYTLFLVLYSLFPYICWVSWSPSCLIIALSILRISHFNTSARNKTAIINWVYSMMNGDVE